MVDRGVLVWVDKETQIQRLMGRDGFSREAAINRIEKQMELDEKRRGADFFIDNTGTLEELEGRVREVFEKLMEINRTGAQQAAQKT